MSVSEPATLDGEQPPLPQPPQPQPPTAAGTPWFVIVGLWGVAGIALVTVSFALARDNTDLNVARVLIWAALAAIAGSALVRMLAHSTSRTERILIVALTALLLYWTKVLHDPAGLFFADEFHHLANTERLVESGRLYTDNPVLPVSADYPGLALVTTALSELSGLGLFTSALVVIGLAKVMLLVALFLIFERLSGSERLAGVAALLYCAHSNFMFFTSQYSYESLSLPLLAVVLLCVVGRRGADRPERVAWSVLGCVLVAAIATTHHLTAYALIVLLWAQVGVVHWRRRPDLTAPIAMAVTATVTGLAWATFVAGNTASYLGDIFGRVARAVSRAFGDTSVARAPFSGGGGGGGAGSGGVFVEGTPPDDVLLALASVGLVALAVLAGVLVARRRSWQDPLVVVLAVSALAAVGAFSLRVLPGAWETSNRTSEFLFIGVALMAGVAAVWFVDRGGGWRLTAVAAAGVIAIAGGSVIGWPANARLPRALTAEASNGRIQPPGPRMAQWAGANLPRDSVIIANPTDGRLLSLKGFQHLLVGSPGVLELLLFDEIAQWQWDLMRRERVDFIVLNRRLKSFNSAIGYFYPRPREANDAPFGNWRTVRRKYARLPGSKRVYDSGDIVIFDISEPVRELKEPPFDAG